MSCGTCGPSTTCGSSARIRRRAARPPVGAGRRGRRGGRRRTGSTTCAARSAPSRRSGSRDEDEPMIDVRRLRAEPDYRAGIERKRVAPGLIDEVLAADEARRAALGEVEELRARQNAASKEIGRAAPEDRPAKIAAAASLKDELAEREPLLAEAEARFTELVIRVPNPAHPSG